MKRENMKALARLMPHLPFGFELFHEGARKIPVWRWIVPKAPVYLDVSC